MDCTDIQVFAEFITTHPQHARLLLPVVNYVRNCISKTLEQLESDPILKTFGDHNENGDSGPVHDCNAGSRGSGCSEQALQGQTDKDQALPDQALPDQALQGQALPDQALPDQALPDQALPDQTHKDLTPEDQKLIEREFRRDPCIALNGVCHDPVGFWNISWQTISPREVFETTGIYNHSQQIQSKGISSRLENGIHRLLNAQRNHIWYERAARQGKGENSVRRLLWQELGLTGNQYEYKRRKIRAEHQAGKTFLSYPALIAFFSPDILSNPDRQKKREAILVRWYCKQPTKEFTDIEYRIALLKITFVLRSLKCNPWQCIRSFEAWIHDASDKEMQSTNADIKRAFQTWIDSHGSIRPLAESFFSRFSLVEYQSAETSDIFLLLDRISNGLIDRILKRKCRPSPVLNREKSEGSLGLDTLAMAALTDARADQINSLKRRRSTCHDFEVSDDQLGDEAANDSISLLDQRSSPARPEIDLEDELTADSSSEEGTSRRRRPSEASSEPQSGCERSHNTTDSRNQNGVSDHTIVPETNWSSPPIENYQQEQNTDDANLGSEILQQGQVPNHNDWLSPMNQHFPQGQSGFFVPGSFVPTSFGQVQDSLIDQTMMLEQSFTGSLGYADESTTYPVGSYYPFSWQTNSTTAYE